MLVIWQGSDLFDPRLLKNVIKMVDVSYGGEAGFNQAIELSAETLGSVKLVQVCFKFSSIRYCTRFT